MKELISTDYIDAEASQSVRKDIEAHLKSCAGCRAFEQALREKVSQPLRKIEAVKPPEEIWQRIKETIEKEQEDQCAPSFLESLVDFLCNNFLVRKPAFAFSTIISVILIVLFFSLGPFHKQQLIKDYLRQQSEFMLSLNESPNGDLDQDFSFGTTIEKYLF
jgi:hypothetical protein